MTMIDECTHLMREDDEHAPCLRCGQTEKLADSWTTEPEHADCGVNSHLATEAALQYELDLVNAKLAAAESRIQMLKSALEHSDKEYKGVKSDFDILTNNYQVLQSANQQNREHMETWITANNNQQKMILELGNKLRKAKKAIKKLSGVWQ